MPVFDFSAAPEDSRQPECTYTTFQSNEETATPEKPIMILDNTKRQWQHHVCGMFTNPVKRTSFEFQEEDGEFSADILKIDSRFVSLLGRESYQCPTVGSEQSGWLCCLQDP